jgi:hypothetical protein
VSAKKSQWDDDLDDAFDFNDDDDVYRPQTRDLKTQVNSTPSVKLPAVSEISSPQISGKSMESRSTSSASLTSTPVPVSAPVSSGGDTGGKATKVKPVKAPVKKLEVTKDDWEDF